jgi:hypothetical protein
MRNSCGSLSERSNDKRPHEKPRHSWEVGVKIDIKKHSSGSGNTGQAFCLDRLPGAVARSLVS